MTVKDWAIVIPRGDPVADIGDAAAAVDAGVPGGRWWFRPGGLAKSVSVVAEPAPSVGSGNFSIVSWVTPGVRGREYWADSRRPTSARYPAGPGWVMGIYLRPGLSPPERLLFQMSNDRVGTYARGGPWKNYWLSTNAGPDLSPENGPRCVVVTVDAARGELVIWLDGEVMLRETQLVQELATVDLSGQSLLIGDGRDSKQGGPGHPFSGQLHALGIFQGRVLEHAHVQSLQRLMTSALATWNGGATAPMAVAGYGRHGRALGYDVYKFATGDEHRNVIEVESPTIGDGDVSVAAWVKRPSGAPGRQYLADTRAINHGTQARGWVFGFYDHRLLFQLNKGGDTRDRQAANFLSDGAVRLDDDEWHLVAATVDRAGLVKFFIDGQPAGSQQFSAGTFAGENLDGASLLIGRSRDANSTVSGEIDALVVVQGVLDDGQVARMAQRPTVTTGRPDAAAAIQEVLGRPVVRKIESPS